MSEREREQLNLETRIRDQFKRWNLLLLFISRLLSRNIWLSLFVNDIFSLLSFFRCCLVSDGLLNRQVTPLSLSLSRNTTAYCCRECAREKKKFSDVCTFALVRIFFFFIIYHRELLNWKQLKWKYVDMILKRWDGVRLAQTAGNYHLFVRALRIILRVRIFIKTLVVRKKNIYILSYFHYFVHFLCQRVRLAR